MIFQLYFVYSRFKCTSQLLEKILEALGPSTTFIGFGIKEESFEHFGYVAKIGL
jgi:hypothetical protein